MSAISVEILEELRLRVLPMIRLVAAEYERRVPDGYPIVIDSVGSGLVGIEIDPNFALYFTVEEAQPFADFYWRTSRIDARTSASREKFAGSPLYDRRAISLSISDVELRNLIAELISRYNFQPGLIHISDS